MSRAGMLKPANRGALDWLGGFNLMPHREQHARRTRRRCMIEWLAAALAGCIAVGVLAGWQVYERARVDALRAAQETRLARWHSSIVEHAGLVAEARARRERVARAALLSIPLTNLLNLLEALSEESGNGIVVKQLRQRVQQSELLARSVDPVAPADWIRQLSGVRGVTGAEFTDLRVAPRSEPDDARSSSTALEFVARFRWNDPANALETALHAPARASLTPSVKPSAPVTPAQTSRQATTHVSGGAQ